MTPLDSSVEGRLQRAGADLGTIYRQSDGVWHFRTSLTLTDSQLELLLEGMHLQEMVNYYLKQRTVRLDQLAGVIITDNPTRKPGPIGL